MVARCCYEFPKIFLNDFALWFDGRGPRSAVQPVLYDVLLLEQPRRAVSRAKFSQHSLICVYSTYCIGRPRPALRWFILWPRGEHDYNRWLRRANICWLRQELWRWLWLGLAVAGCQAVGRSWRYRQINEINGNEILYHNLENVLGTYHVLCARHVHGMNVPRRYIIWMIRMMRIQKRWEIDWLNSLRIVVLHESCWRSVKRLSN